MKKVMSLLSIIFSFFAFSLVVNAQDIVPESFDVVFESKVKQGGSFSIEMTPLISTAHEFNINEDRVMGKTYKITLPEGFSFSSTSEIRERNGISECNIVTISEENNLYDVKCETEEHIIYVASDTPLSDYNVSITWQDNGVTLPVKVIGSKTIELTGMISEITVKEGDSLDYLLNIKNIGEYAVENVVVENILSEYVTLIGMSEVFPFENNKITISIPKLEVNEEKDVLIKTKVKEAPVDTEIVNVVKISADGLDAKQLAMTAVVKKANIEITSSFNQEEVKSDEDYSYQITVKNTGGIRDNNVVIRVPVDENFEIIDAAGAKIENNILIWTIDQLDPNQEKTFNIVVRKKADNIITDADDKDDNKDKEPDESDKTDDSKIPTDDKKDSNDNLNQPKDNTPQNNPSNPENPNTAADGWGPIFLAGILSLSLILVIRRKNKNYFFKI